MRINIISHKNGVGLQQDVELLESLLSGHDVEFVETHDSWGRPRQSFPNVKAADLNIFVELCARQLFQRAKKNVLIPNPEWWWDMRALPRFDYILCKTRDCQKIYAKYHPRTIYTGFTSKDMKLDGIVKSIWGLHAAGKSSAKGTEAVFDCWENNPKFNNLIFCKHGDFQQYQNAVNNIIPVFQRLEEAEYRKLFNRCLLHVCPSMYEGFGHYIWEAMSVESVVITTDAPPMNEFITDQRFLVKYTQATKKHRNQNSNLGLFYKVSPVTLAETMKRVYSIGEDELIKAGKENRQKYLQNDAEFRQRFVKIIESI